MTGDDSRKQSDEPTQQAGDSEEPSRIELDPRRLLPPARDLRIRAEEANASAGAMPVTSNTTVRNTYAPVKLERTEIAHCTEIGHLGTIVRVPVTARDVVKQYLRNLMDTGRVPKKTRLADAMKTSRTQVYSALREGRITVDHIEALARYLHSTPASILGELAGLAAIMDKAAVTSTSVQSELPGRVDRTKFLSGDRPESPGDGEPGEPGAPSTRSPRRRQPGAQSPRPKR